MGASPPSLEGVPVMGDDASFSLLKALSLRSSVPSGPRHPLLTACVSEAELCIHLCRPQALQAPVAALLLPVRTPTLLIQLWYHRPLSLQPPAVLFEASYHTLGLASLKYNLYLLHPCPYD